MAENRNVNQDNHRRESLMSKIGMGLFCSCIVTVMMNFLRIKKFIIYACSAVVALFGSPEGGGIAEKAEKAAEKATTTIEKMTKAFDPKVIRDGIISAREEAKRDVMTAYEQARAKQKELELEIEKKKEEARRGIEERKEKSRIAAEERQQKAMEQIRVANEAREKQQQEQAEWEKKYGHNAQCPSCRYGMRLAKSGKSQIRCPRCGDIFSTSRARALGSPNHGMNPYGGMGVPFHAPTRRN